MYTLKKQTRTILFVIFSIMILILAGLIALEIFVPDTESVSAPLVKGTGDATMTYTVHLKENPVTDADEMEQGQYYLKPFIDYIDVNCDLALDLDQETNFVVLDQINVILVSQLGTDEEVKVIWEKAKAIAPPEENESTGKSVASNRHVRLRFESYDALVTSLIDEYELMTDYVIKVEYVGTVSFEHKGVTKEERFTSYIVIPFTNPIIEISGKQEDTREVSIDQEIEKNAAFDMSLIALFAAGILVCFGIILIIRFKTKALVREDAYSQKVADIFKEYGNRLAGLSETLFYQSSVMISIDKVEDMVKIADEIGQTVFYYQADDEAERKIEFYVFDEGRIYYLVLFGSL